MKKRKHGLIFFSQKLLASVMDVSLETASQASVWNCESLLNIVELHNVFSDTIKFSSLVSEGSNWILHLKVKVNSRHCQLPTHDFSDSVKNLYVFLWPLLTRINTVTAMQTNYLSKIARTPWQALAVTGKLHRRSRPPLKNRKLQNGRIMYIFDF